jgi:hypothetical protein
MEEWKMDTFYISVRLPDGSERDLEVDVRSLGDLSQYSESEMDRELRDLINEQYPELAGKVVEIYC